MDVWIQGDPRVARVFGRLSLTYIHYCVKNRELMKRTYKFKNKRDKFFLRLSTFTFLSANNSKYIGTTLEIKTVFHIL